MPQKSWFEYPIRVQPHHTDYAGIVWHGAYITWLEEARIECLRQAGAEFTNWVAMGIDLPVVDLSLRYHRALQLGMKALLKTRLSHRGVRLNWHYEIHAIAPSYLCLTGQVTLVPIDRTHNKIMRSLPSEVRQILKQLNRQFGD
ncbi:acyl-CoA thioesterase [Almyronema epifaneia]|uniref:Acyl-CoA thioesterase n=1 Tax=Almyronema epifaneia S1 TaxID=2991925 RepID=A0ABW6IDG2_9CYAN